jgi:hypothetical protein
MVQKTNKNIDMRAAIVKIGIETITEEYRKKQKNNKMGKKCECCGKMLEIVMAGQRFCPACALYTGKIKSFADYQKRLKMQKRQKNKKKLDRKTRKKIIKINAYMADAHKTKSYRRNGTEVRGYNRHAYKVSSHSRAMAKDLI